MLKIPPSVRSLLSKHNLNSPHDIIALSIQDLSDRTGLSHEEAEIIHHTLHSITTHPPVSALTLNHLESSLGSIRTSSTALDALLSPNGGIPIGLVTEVCGAPGVGKTQFAVQICLNAQRYHFGKGSGSGSGSGWGEAIFIDSEGSFMVDRVKEMADAMVNEVNEELGEGEKKVVVEEVLDRIHYFRVRDYLEHVAVIESLHTFLQTHPNVKVIVMDSIAFHFRHNFSDMAHRNRLLNTISQTCMRYAQTYSLAVVMTNQMTTRFGQVGGLDEAKLVPALGDSWAHACSIRVIFSLHGTKRIAELVKSSAMPCGSVEYCVNSFGIRDVKSEIVRKRGSEVLSEE